MRSASPAPASTSSLLPESSPYTALSFFYVTIDQHLFASASLLTSCGAHSYCGEALLFTAGCLAVYLYLLDFSSSLQLWNLAMSSDIVQCSLGNLSRWRTMAISELCVPLESSEHYIPFPLLCSRSLLLQFFPLHFVLSVSLAISFFIGSFPCLHKKCFYSFPKYLLAPLCPLPNTPISLLLRTVQNCLKMFVFIVWNLLFPILS